MISDYDFGPTPDYVEAEDVRGNKIFYAIYDVDRKLFKGRGRSSGSTWSSYPTQTYDTEGRATSAMKSHLKRQSSWNSRNIKNLIVIPINVSWLVRVIKKF